MSAKAGGREPGADTRRVSKDSAIHSSDGRVSGPLASSAKPVVEQDNRRIKQRIGADARIQAIRDGQP
jgi:hypothetical protein